MNRFHLSLITILMTASLACAVTISAQAQTQARLTVSDRTTDSIATELLQFGDIDLFVFANRAAFLARMDETLGLGNIRDPDATFASLPRSPFTVTGRKNGKPIASCQIFVPANITPESGNEIFAQLMRGWFGAHLSYETSAGLTYRWLIYHEVRHCKPDHFGDEDVKSHDDELNADLFAFDQLATPENRAALARDIIGFRIITSALFADKSHMTGLSLKYALDPEGRDQNPDKAEEIAAFVNTRQMIGNQARAIAAQATPTSLELIRAITELREKSEAGTLQSNDPRMGEILIELDDAIARFAPRLHASVATRRPD